MMKFGQFLISPAEFFGWFNGPGFIGVGFIVFTVVHIRGYYLLKLIHTLTPESYLKGLTIGGAVSILLTCVLYTTSACLLETAAHVSGASVNADRFPRIPHIPIPNNPKGRLVVVVALVLLAIAAGYAFTLLQLSFWGHLGAMIVGVGLPEELAKAGAGLVILYCLCATGDMTPTQFRRAVIGAFGIAGLGFGAAESLKYFGEYTASHVDATFYYPGNYDTHV